MTQLFYPPKFDSGLAGAKLTFSISGTTTLQNTYQDEALTTPHANPVVADANGVFAPIYFDGRLDSYRVKYTTSADVLIYQVDGYPSSPGSVGTSITLAEKNNPFFRMTQINGSSGKKNWLFQVETNQYKWTLENDALSTEADILVVDRSGNIATSVAWTASAYTINGDESYRGRIARTTGIVSRNTTTTLAADAELVLALRASASYVIEGELYFYATTTAAMGFKFDASYSATLSSARNGIAMSYVNGAGTVGQMAAFPATPVSFATISTNVLAADSCRFSYNVTTTTAGNLSVRWAQASSSGNNLNLLDSSWLRATRV